MSLSRFRLRTLMIAMAVMAAWFAVFRISRAWGLVLAFTVIPTVLAEIFLGRADRGTIATIGFSRVLALALYAFLMV